MTEIWFPPAAASSAVCGPSRLVAIFCLVCLLTCCSDLLWDMNQTLLFHKRGPALHIPARPCLWAQKNKNTHSWVIDAHTPTHVLLDMQVRVTHSWGQLLIHHRELIPSSHSHPLRCKQLRGVSRRSVRELVADWLNDVLLFLRPTRKTPRAPRRWRASRFSCRSSWRANSCRRRWPSSSTRGNDSAPLKKSSLLSAHLIN